MLLFVAAFAPRAAVARADPWLAPPAVAALYTTYALAGGTLTTWTFKVGAAMIYIVSLPSR